MAYKIGDKVIYLRTSGEIEKNKIMRYTITLVSKNGLEVQVDNKHKANNCLYSTFLLPDDLRSWAFLQSQKARIIRHKEENNAESKEFYQLNNQFIREGIR